LPYTLSEKMRLSGGWPFRGVVTVILFCSLACAIDLDISDERKWWNRLPTDFYS